MTFAIFRNFFVLFSISVSIAFGQVSDNVAFIELSASTFSIDRPFTISVIIPNSEDRATVAFPDIPGFTKKGITTSVTPSEVNGKTVTSQVIMQTYQALAPGRFRLSPFTIEVNKETVSSEGAILIVEPSAKVSAPLNTTLNTLDIDTKGAAFLDIRTSKANVFTGEGLTLALSFFVADNYPYTLDFKGLDKQIQTITKKIRPTNTWEENLPITELKPIPVSIRGKKFREIRLYQSIFFPLSNQDIKLPPVSIQLTRTRPVIGPPSAQLEKALFTSKPLTIRVDALPKHPLRGRAPVGSFHLEEGLERQGVTIGQSIRYTFTITGEGNIATLPTPTLLNEVNELDVFPPEERHTTMRIGNQIMGRKTFTYFIVPRQNGQLSLANHFQWIYFDPRTAKYDTLQSKLRLLVGDKSPEEDGQLSAGTSNSSLGSETAQSPQTDNSIYAGIATMDSTRQPISISVLIRAIANVLILIMLLGMIFVFFKKQNTSR
ncbi:BatD family protein [Spirosoma harenae]